VPRKRPLSIQFERAPAEISSDARSGTLHTRKGVAGRRAPVEHGLPDFALAESRLAERIDLGSLAVVQAQCAPRTLPREPAHGAQYQSRKGGVDSAFRTTRSYQCTCRGASDLVSVTDEVATPGHEDRG